MSKEDLTETVARIRIGRGADVYTPRTRRLEDERTSHHFTPLQCSRMTPLHKACVKGYAEVVKKLLDKVAVIEIDPRPA